jgi:hypothetical protein
MKIAHMCGYESGFVAVADQPLALAAPITS